MARLTLFIFCLLPALSYAESDCHSLAKTELEKTYCQIAATPEAGKLPSFADFRRNDPQVQKLLLKGSARRLGIDLPGNAGNHNRPARRQATATVAAPPQQPPPPTTNESRPAKKNSATASQNANSTVTQARRPPQNGLAGCQFLGESIQCDAVTYRLVNNQQNRELASGVLSADNVLVLPPFAGNIRDEIAVNNYLADSYTHYVDKMLLIGLGGSTMTYTKFHYTYWDLVEKGEDFGKRVGQMYDFLKQDKASMVVKARYDRELPAGIDWCQVLRQHIVICDNGRKNWVYRHESD